MPPFSPTGGVRLLTVNPHLSLHPGEAVWALSLGSSLPQSGHLGQRDTSAQYSELTRAGEWVQIGSRPGGGMG